MINNKQEFIEEYLTTLKREYGVTLEEAREVDKYKTLATVVQNISMENMAETRLQIKSNSVKQLYYFSMEFLIGRLLTSNLMNLGIYQYAKDGLSDLGINIKSLEEIEPDAGLGNGGLGRLAACFIDSIASNSYIGHGFTIRYRNGFFNQSFENGYQIEQPDRWLKDGNPWESRKTSYFDVKFYGQVVSEIVNGVEVFKTINTQNIRAIAYDMPIIGYKTKITNRLRMFSSAVSDEIPTDMDFKSYENTVSAITDCLYPDDSTYEGKKLRLKQQYFFTSAGLNTAIRYHLSANKSLDNFAQKNVLQINDTHPAVLIAEFMRVLIDEHNYKWDQAWEIVNKSCAYTNHTILKEALETWPIDLFQPLLPRVFMIIEELNQRFCKELFDKGYDLDEISKLAIISNGNIHMANLAIIGSFSVNGVAKIHTQILKEIVMSDWNKIYPTKFNNITNGITHRRWFEYCNPNLANVVKEYIGDSYITNPVSGFEKLLDHQDNEELLIKMKDAKLARKKILADYIKKVEGVDIDPNSIFDVQIKRLHAYKRQLLNALHILYLYDKLKNDEEFRNNYYPHTFIFGAKAAPSYYFAKNVIKLIQTIANMINNDIEVNSLLKVVFVTNYNTSYAQMIIPAADISEQISTAGYEASGTGNMKFMMNGAITLGTMDGANVEIFELVGNENIEIFGMNKDEVIKLTESNLYNPYNIIDNNLALKLVINRLSECNFNDLTLHEHEFDLILKTLFEENDTYFVLQDFNAYVLAHEKLNELYKDSLKWNKICLINIAKSGYFSSDRTINNYVEGIWKLNKLEF